MRRLKQTRLCEVMVRGEERRGHGGVGSLCKSQSSKLRTDSWYAGGGDI